jgi:hypothetical protein
MTMTGPGVSRVPDFHRNSNVGHSARNPRSFTTLPHLTFYSLRDTAYCADVLATISKPIFVNRPRTSGSPSTTASGPVSALHGNALR